MSAALLVRSGGLGLSIQDLGRPGYLAYGLARGGAADRLALYEGAALLAQSPKLAALEMPGSGGTFEATADMRIALTGAPMRAHIDGTPLAWNASHHMPKGAQLSIGGALTGSYGYLHVGGGFDTPALLGARAAHLLCGIGRMIETGDVLPTGAAPAQAEAGFCLPQDDRFEGGTIRVLPTPQTALFDPSQIERFAATTFTRDSRGNRMGVRLCQPGEGFGTQAGLSILSDIVTPGDIQVTGDGTPFVLLSECETTGGYPRIGTVLPADLPRVAQARAGASLRFTFVTLDEARDIEAQEAARRAALPGKRQRLVRRLEDIRDLLSYQLISGVTAGYDLDDITKEPA